MSECLITRLKSSVNDINLRKIGEFRFAKTSGYTPTKDNSYVDIKLTVAQDVTVRILNDGVFYVSNTIEEDTTAGKIKTFKNTTVVNFWVSPGSIVSVLYKYDIYKFYTFCVDMNLSEMSNMTNMSYLHLPINDTYKNNLNGNIESLKKLNNLSYVNLLKSNINGDITEVFGSNINLTALHLPDTYVSGSLNDFVAAQIAAGRKSATIDFMWPQSYNYVTLDGVALKNNTTITSNSSTTKLSWNENGEITWS